ncbi:MAG: UDP-N-acetylmuramoyl-L-alanine--D-glutamate ligase, partial [Chryseobacterium sp.]|nr:UDP-N-acetylmuramoyl-L-alanine--D-glutamate ligase [Chryseobacterium sp.]
MKIVVLGGGESGFGAAYLAKKKGLEVFLSDKGLIKDDYKKLLIDAGIEFEEGKHDEERILAADWIIKSPGIPKKAEIISKINRKGIRISSEIEFASEFTDAKIIAITGSNGKTTTTSLIYHILKNDDLKVGLGGNICKSFAKQVADENFDYYVLEVSSFQLDDIQNFRPYISMLLNLSQDHLDQYNYNYEEYALAKFRIAENQENDNFFIYNKDDEMSMNLLEKLEIKAKMIPFSLKENLNEGGYLSEDKMTIKLDGNFSIKIDELALVGNHNVANSLAASIAGKILKISNESIRNSLMTFQAVEHRLEQVAEIDGVKFINDSKATNVNATYYALESMKQPTIWIVGGVDKGNDYTEIEALVKRKVKAIVCLGIDNQKILDFFK